MSWTRSSKLALGVTVVAVFVLGAGALGAAAVPFEGDPPESAEVGDEVEIEQLRMTEPFQVSEEGWTMRVSTELENPRLQVTALDSPGNTVGEKEFDVTNSTVTMEIDDNSINEVVFSIRGDVPVIAGPGPGAYSYENRDRENITVLEIAEVFESQVETVENGTFELHRFTPDSRSARQAIDSSCSLVPCWRWWSRSVVSRTICARDRSRRTSSSNRVCRPSSRLTRASRRPVWHRFLTPESVPSSRRQCSAT